ncbi:MAG: acetyl-CoA carboxylase carboxyltransferase subunit beta [Deltaproteobacteria bacterium]|uniref:Acetyl-coenzyme A carboxylase carboxyl transferase subunit beta n=1 Tax=Candidatus Zymogenus saltonus TaxID=2844893 RepID=A0A9D8KE85_9DELT|nr:acetyl-CoA carboxylase carboxyltransferase subunit beta [Candidatus Zymogenus saltonus]
MRKDKASSVKLDEAADWVKCPGCSNTLFSREIERNLSVCTSCGYHFRIGARKRIETVTDRDSLKELFSDLKPGDPLGFVDERPYPDRIKNAREKTGESEAVVTGSAKISGIDVVISVMDFDFMGGSMGSVVGEKVTLAAEKAAKEKIPLVSFVASGGARMQEGLISLMQMAKTTGAVSRLKDSGAPYISILTNPTTGGVAASFGMLGDINIAEPGAVIGFAGRRVIEQTINQKPPDNFQKAEELLKHGMIDMIVERKSMKNTIFHLLEFFTERTKK